MQAGRPFSCQLQRSSSHKVIAVVDRWGAHRMGYRFSFGDGRVCEDCLPRHNRERTMAKHLRNHRKYLNRADCTPDMELGLEASLDGSQSPAELLPLFLHVAEINIC